MALIQFDSVTKTYGRGDAAVTALDRVDFTIASGEFVAIMGPSGSGKSTAMNILGCLDVPTIGTYCFGGVDVGGLTRKQRALLRRYDMGFVFQGFNLLERTTAAENVELPLLYRGLGTSERRSLALAALTTVGLSGRQHHTPAELSGGQMQRVAIARAMVGDPKLLFADEPTGNLDSGRSAEIMDLITRFNRERGVTVVMVTHDPDMAAYAHRTIRFRDGHIEPAVPRHQPC
jgi:putative ABC transport system ATP-binding protein